MKIAVVAPSPIPFGAGGAEKLWWGLVDNITKSTKHQCELIKLPITENDFWGVIGAYKLFSELDLSHFDMVISGKYPAWMIQHPNHHVYMLHCLRGFYDTFDFMGLPEEYKTSNQDVLSFLERIRSNDISREEVFTWLDSIKSSDSIPQDLFNFPGAFARELVHFFDNDALSKAQKISAISQTVANRQEYFPEGASVDVIYPPSTLTGFKNKSSKYFFTASRLDDAKRIKTIVQAYKKTKTTVPLKIAGTGPLLDELLSLSEEDNRIEFVGYVSDMELVEYYANAYAIIFIPYDEDYGLITVEAMASEKPVITFSDSGGVTEFVENGITGLVSEPDINLLAQNIDKISSDTNAIVAMGKAAKKKVADISWHNTISSLIVSECSESPSIDKHSERKLKKITVVSTYCFYPPQGGGQNRIFYLYKELAKNMKVEIVCLAHESDTYERIEVAPNLFQIKVPKSHQHALKEWEIEEKACIPVTDIAFSKLYKETPLLTEVFQDSVLDSDFVVCSHPYSFTMIKELCDKPIIHESHNVEFLLKKQMLSSNKYNNNLLDDLYELEKRAFTESVFTTVCSEKDSFELAKLYETSSTNNTIVVPNGVDLNSVKFTAGEDKAAIKEALGLVEHEVALFIGSWHQPNIEAVDEIIKLAKQLPSYHFIIIGSVGAYYESHNLPENVAMAGLVSDEEKQLFLQIADVGLNPMLTGSGTNLKMLDYMAAGVPVISTNVGARGLDIPRNAAHIVSLQQFSSCIARLDELNVELAASHARRKFNWSAIKDTYELALIGAIT